VIAVMNLDFPLNQRLSIQQRSNYQLAFRRVIHVDFVNILML
jgi:hypothetical protein